MLLYPNLAQNHSKLGPETHFGLRLAVTPRALWWRKGQRESLPAEQRPLLALKDPITKPLASPAVDSAPNRVISSGIASLNGSLISNVHDVIPQERLVVLHLAEEALKGIPRIDDADWCPVDVEDRYSLETSALHH